MVKPGTFVTGCYLGVLIRLGWDNWYEFTTMEPHLWGDFLAGAFAPLAFLWFVIGYFQQGAALRVQAMELQKQIAVMERQAKATQELVREAEWQTNAQMLS